MLSFKRPDEVRQYVIEKTNAAAMQRMALASRVGTDECYYEGIQYLISSDNQFVATTTGRLPVNINPDMNKLRIVWNEITKRIIKARAATWPSNMEVTIDPPIRDGGVEASVQAHVLEDMLQAWVKKMGFLDVSRTANDRRSICGTFGIGLQLKSKQRLVGMDGQNIPMNDVRLEPFVFHPLRLILDTGVQHRDLRLHEDIIYQDVWTADAIRSAFPLLKFNEANLKTVGQLTPHEQEVSRLSAGRLFGRFRQYSTTKGARVYQIHHKDETGRFGIMYSAVEIGDSGWEVVNFDNPVSPFGGDGLPMVLIHGHPRADSMWSFSDVSMAKDAQDILNLTMTWYMRAAQKHTCYQWMVDKRWMGRQVSDEDVQDKFTNVVGGVVIGNPQLGDRIATPPTLVNSPAPNNFLLEMQDRASGRLLSDTFRTEQDLGENPKTHIPAESTRMFSANSGQVLGIRVEEDRRAYGQILNVALGTLVKNVQMQSPSTASMLTEEGFDEQDFAVILGVDPNYAACGLTVQESSIRYRSPDEKKADLMELAATPVPAIDGPSLRMALADLDMPVTEDDKHMRQEISKTVARLIQGQPWEPLPLGEYNVMCLAQLRRALFDHRVRMNPQIQAMVVQAIAVQVQAGVQESIAGNPQMVADQRMHAEQLQAQNDQAQMEQGQEEQGSSEGPPSTVGEMFNQLAAGAGPT